MTNKKYLLIFALALFSCNQQDASKANIKPAYFDLKGYFQQEILRLKSQNTLINKTVSVNGETEQKRVAIDNWEKELTIFINADINKASWNGSFAHSKKENKDLYLSNSKKIPVKQVVIVKNGEKVNQVNIIVANNNILYHSIDTLTYIPDSLYEIKKTQKIRFLGEKRYNIIGKWK